MFDNHTGTKEAIHPEDDKQIMNLIESMDMVSFELLVDNFEHSGINITV
jgi:hypothetical protein